MRALALRRPVPAGRAAAPSRDGGRRALDPFLTAGILLTGTLIGLIVLGAFWTPYEPTAMSVEKFLAPCARHLFGTDNFGRDLFSRVLRGAGTTLWIATATVAVGAAAGVTLGAVTGYFGGLADAALMRLADTLTAFPSILLALVVIGIVGPGRRANVVLALGLAFVPSYARIARTAWASARDANYVQSARLMGVPAWRIVLVHILPNTLPVLLPALTIGFNNAVLAEASMSYLGIGVTPPDASLGYMLSEAQGMFARAPWYALSTGLTIVLLVFGVGLIGEGLQRRGGDGIL